MTPDCQSGGEVKPHPPSLATALNCGTSSNRARVRVHPLARPGGIPKLRLENGLDDVAARIWELHGTQGPYRTMLIPLEEGRE